MWLIHASRSRKVRRTVHVCCHCSIISRQYVVLSSAPRKTLPTLDPFGAEQHARSQLDRNIPGVRLEFECHGAEIWLGMLRGFPSRCVIGRPSIFMRSYNHVFLPMRVPYHLPNFVLPCSDVRGVDFRSPSTSVSPPCRGPPSPEMIEVLSLLERRHRKQPNTSLPNVFGIFPPSLAGSSLRANITGRAEQYEVKWMRSDMGREGRVRVYFAQNQPPHKKHSPSTVKKPINLSSYTIVLAEIPTQPNTASTSNRSGQRFLSNPINSDSLPRTTHWITHLYVTHSPVPNCNSLHIACHWHRKGHSPCVQQHDHIWVTMRDEPEVQHLAEKESCPKN